MQSLHKFFLKVFDALAYTWWSCLWDEIMSLNCSHQWSYCSSHRWHMSMENHGGMMLIGENSWLVHQSYLAILPAQTSSSKSGECWQRKWRVWPLKYLLFVLWTDPLHAIKSYNMGPTALPLLTRKACCRFLLPFKIHCLSWVCTHKPWIH
jgi:hypothetical protein